MSGTQNIPSWYISRPSFTGRWQITRNGVVVATDRSSAMGIYVALKSMICDLEAAAAAHADEASIKIYEEETE